MHDSDVRFYGREIVDLHSHILGLVFLEYIVDNSPESGTSDSAAHKSYGIL